MEHIHDCECIVATCGACLRDLGVIAPPSGHYVWVPDDISEIAGQPALIGG